MATFKISIYEYSVELTSDLATCELSENFEINDVLTAASELLRASPYHSSTAKFAIEDAADGHGDFEPMADGWDDGIYRVDCIAVAEVDEETGDSICDNQSVAMIEIERI